jgi:hypothetical protein
LVSVPDTIVNTINTVEILEIDTKKEQDDNQINQQKDEDDQKLEKVSRISSPNINEINIKSQSPPILLNDQNDQKIVATHQKRLKNAEQTTKFQNQNQNSIIINGKRYYRKYSIHYLYNIYLKP